MGFDVSYSTTERISPSLQREIIEEAKGLYTQHSWVHVMGPVLNDDGGYLTGSSRLSPQCDEDDAADARLGAAPDGTLTALLDSLCKLSAQFDIEFEIEHDHSEGSVGVIRHGKADEAVQSTFDGLDAMFEGIEDGFDMPDEF